jgi:peroxiredoxin Q/BCP
MKWMIVAGIALFVVVAAGALLSRSASAKNATMPAVGDVAPGFTLPSQDGEKISLASFKGKWVVLYFYPKDMTSGCTIEAHNFQRDLKLYEDKNAVILGVSVDSTDSHKEFCTKESLSFRLLADTEHTVTESYGTFGFMGMKIASRNTFLIGPDGKIAKVWTGVSPSKHSEEVLAAIQELSGK